MRNTVIAVLGAAAALAGCAEDGAVTPKGGQAFEVPFTTVTSVKYPGMIARAFGRTVNNAAVVDSIVGEVTLMKQLDGLARYQFYLGRHGDLGDSQEAGGRTSRARAR